MESVRPKSEPVEGTEESEFRDGLTEEFAQLNKVIPEIDISELNTTNQKPSEQASSIKMARNAVAQTAWEVTKNGSYMERGVSPPTPWQLLVEPAHIFMLDSTIWISHALNPPPMGAGTVNCHTLQIDPRCTTITRNGSQFIIRDYYQQVTATNPSKEFKITIRNEQAQLDLRRRLRSLNFTIA